MQNPTLRPLNPDRDFPALAELLNRVRTQKVTAAQLHEWEINLPPGRLRRELIAVTKDDTFIGRSLITHRPAAEDGRYYFDVAVDPAYRQQGVGNTLFEDAYQFALDNGARILDADVYDNCPFCLRFAEKRGFTIDRHLFESTLDLRGFDPGSFSGLVENVETAGIRLFSLAEGGNSEELRRRLYDVNYQIALDDPASHGTFPSYEEFTGFVFPASWFDPEGQILAADGEQIIGLSAVGYFAEQNLAENLITGVLPAYRGRKIAQALKVVALRFAKSCGAHTARTHNDSQNGPMLAINRKLGYQPQVGEYRMTRIL